MIRKSESPKGAGWQQIPGGKRGGYRRRKSGGGWEYWYRSAKHAHEHARHHADKAAEHDDRAAELETKANAGPPALRAARGRAIQRARDEAHKHRQAAEGAKAWRNANPTKEPHYGAVNVEQEHTGRKTLGPDEGVVWSTVSDLLGNLVTDRDGYIGVAEDAKFSSGSVRVKGVDGRTHLVKIRVKVGSGWGGHLASIKRPVYDPRTDQFDHTRSETVPREVVLNIPSGAKLTKKDWAEERLRATLAHELAHAMDVINHASRSEKYSDHGKEYVNDPAEVVAFRHMIFREMNTPEVKEWVDDTKATWAMDKEEADDTREWEREEGRFTLGIRAGEGRITGDRVVNALSKYSETWKQINHLLTPANRRKILQTAAHALAQHHDGTSKPMRKAIKLGLPLMGPPPSPNREEYPYTGSMNFQGILVYIENAKGSTRSGVGRDGTRWAIRMKHHYGEIPGTQGADGDPVDVYMGPNPLASIAYVIHQKVLIGDEHQAPLTYDEDKVMLGFDSEADALHAWASHFDRPVLRPGVTAMPMDELRRMVVCDEAGLGAIVKSWPPKGGGWHPIPGGKRGGYRRKTRSGYDYAYPDQKQTTAHKWERDYSRTAEDMQPGDLATIGGRSGKWRFTPDHAEAEGDPGAGKMWFTSEATGEHEAHRPENVQPLRIAQPKPEPKVRAQRKRRPPPRRPRKPSKPTPGVGTTGGWTGPVSGPGDRKAPPVEPGQEPTGAGTRMAAPYSGTEFEPGTVMYDLESGVFPLVQIKETSDRGERFKWAVYVPKDRRNAIVNHPEVQARIKSITSEMMTRFKLKGAAQRDQVRAGAMLGLVQALRNYVGGRPFLAAATLHMRTAAFREARHEQGGPALPDRTMRNLHSYLAARAQAGEEATPEGIAKLWRVKKKHVKPRVLGSNYQKDEDTIVDQGNEEVPFGPWRVKGPDGKEHGPEQQGKLQLIEEYTKLLAGGTDSLQSEAMEHHEINVLPGHDSVKYPLGTAFHMRMELEGLLGRLPDDQRTALKMKWGLHDESGDPASAAVIGEALGIKGSEVTVRRKVKALVDQATNRVKRLADVGGLEVRGHIKRWSAEGDDGMPQVAIKHGPLFPSHSDLRRKYGSDAAVRVMQAAIRGGWGTRADFVLRRMKSGAATDEEREELQRDYHAQRDKERQQAFNAYRAQAIDPSAAADFGPQGKSPYDGVSHDHLVTAIKRGQ